MSFSNQFFALTIESLGQIPTIFSKLCGLTINILTARTVFRLETIEKVLFINSVSLFLFS